VNFKICFSADPDPFKNGSGSRPKSENPACKTLLCNADPDPLNTDSDYLYFSYYETRSLDILLSKLNFKPKSFKLSKSTVLARVHGFVRAYMVACALMCLRVCVCACLRAYDLLDLQNYTETQRGTYYFYRTLTAASTVRQDKTTSFPYVRARLRPCFARTQLRARLHGFVRACTGCVCACAYLNSVYGPTVPFRHLSSNRLQ
jgi:hypothetical protein